MLARRRASPGLLIGCAAALLATSGALAEAGPRRAASKRAAPSPDADIVAVLDAQFAAWTDAARPEGAAPRALYAPGAMLSMTGATVEPQVTKATARSTKWTLFGTATLGKRTLRDLHVGRAPDGSAAWVAFAVTLKVDDLSGPATLELRASELLVRTPEGWQIAAAAWSRAVPADRLGLGAPTPLEPPLDRDVGAPDVLAAFDALLTAPAAPVAPAAPAASEGAPPLRPTATGPTPKATASDAALATALRQRLAKAGRTSPAWAVTSPDGATAAVTASSVLDLGNNRLHPARVFAVLTKDAAGAWQLAHLHVAAAPPAPPAR